jgi:hypothetical protein
MNMNHKIRVAAALLLFPLLVLASVEIKGTGTTNVAKVNASNSLQVNEGPSNRVTYYATVSGATTTAAWNIACESSAGLGFKVSKWCVSLPAGATAAGTIITTTLRRSTAAGSGGTAVAAEGTGTTSIGRADPSSGPFPGTCRGLASTLGTAGATIDQFQYPQSVVAAGNAVTAPVVICRDYGLNGEQLPTVAAGTANGIFISVSAAGAGSLAVGSATMVIITEQ